MQGEQNPAQFLISWFCKIYVTDCILCKNLNNTVFLMHDLIFVIKTKSMNVVLSDPPCGMPDLQQYP